MNDVSDSPAGFTYHRDSRRSPPGLRNDAMAQKSPSRHSPIAPLAPLEYLQNQRRGSITDPSLHAAATNNMNHSNVNHHAFRQTETSGTTLSFHDSTQRIAPSDLHTNPSYTFGETATQQFRKLLRSPSIEGDDAHANSLSPNNASPRSPDANSSSGSGFSTRIEGPAKYDQMQPINVDAGLKHDQVLHLSPHEVQNREAQPFDYSMRRHSIAVGHNLHASSSGSHLPILSHGTKRKMSIDRPMFSSVSEESDSQLAGPGVPSPMNIDSDAPAPKRRGSAVDTWKIAQLSLRDRRNSVDSRGGGTSQWWLNERRDSTSSMYSSTPSAGFGSGFPTESPHGRPPSSIAAFAWPTNNQPSEPAGDPTTQNESDTNMAGTPRQFDSNVSQLGMMPSLALSPDRRMSIPDAMLAPSTGPARALRSRSRPPSRQRRADTINTNQSGQSPDNDGSNEDTSSTPPAASSNKQAKDSSSTPYSRSPELRVSHKLAERKRRKEMKELFDELRDHLPADRGSKASKWEILSKTIDFVMSLKQSHQDMAREIDMLRHELESIRQGGMPSFSPGAPHGAVYSQAPVLSGQYTSQPTATISQPAHTPLLSRPSSSENAFPPGGGPSPQGLNGNITRSDPPLT